MKGDEKSSVSYKAWGSLQHFCVSILLSWPGNNLTPVLVPPYDPRVISCSDKRS